MTTSKALDGTFENVARSSSFQRESGAPLKNQPDPLSASSMPYFIIARRTTRTFGEKPVVSKLAFNLLLYDFVVAHQPLLRASNTW